MSKSQNPAPRPSGGSPSLFRGLRSMVFNEAYEGGKTAAIYGFSICADAARYARGAIAEIRSGHHRNRAAVDFDAYVKEHGLTEHHLARRALMFSVAKYVAYFLGILGLTLATLAIGHDSPFQVIFYYIQSTCALVQGYIWGITTYQIRNRRICSVGEAMRDLSSYL